MSAMNTLKKLCQTITGHGAILRRDCKAIRCDDSSHQLPLLKFNLMVTLPWEADHFWSQTQVLRRCHMKKIKALLLILLLS